MTRDIVAAQRVLTQLLTDVQSRRAWELDPRGFAVGHLSGSDEIDMIASLSSPGIGAAAMHLDMKRITSRQKTPTHEPPYFEQQKLDQAPQTAAAFTRPIPLAVPMKPLVGLGYWPGLFQAMSNERATVEVWEHRIDDYLDPSSLDTLCSRVRDSAVVVHSVDLSLGSPEATHDKEILRNMRSVLRATGVQELSDHLGFTRVAGRSLGHFEPIWRVEESMRLIAHNVDRLQDALGVRIALENIASTFDLGGEMTIAEFLNELVTQTGCGVLLDITNLMLNERNGFCDTARELAVLDLDAVVGIHLAGGAEVDGLSYDAHSFPIPDEDIMWLERLLPDLPNCRSVVIERDGRRDEISEVVADLRRVRAAIRGMTASG